MISRGGPSPPTSSDLVDAFFYLAFLEMDAAYAEATGLPESEERARTLAIIAKLMDDILDAWDAKRGAAGG